MWAQEPSEGLSKVRRLRKKWPRPERASLEGTARTIVLLVEFGVMVRDVGG